MLEGEFDRVRVKDFHRFDDAVEGGVEGLFLGIHDAMVVPPHYLSIEVGAISMSGTILRSSAEMAGHRMAWHQFAQWRRLQSTAVEGKGAAGAEAAARGRVHGGRHLSGQDDPLLLFAGTRPQGGG